MRLSFSISCLVLMAGGMAPAVAGEQAAKSYILVDIVKLTETEVKGLGADGYLTIARYDVSSNDLSVSAHKWKAGKQAAIHDRAIAVRSPIQKLNSTRQFLLEVEPGTWVIESANGTVFTKGSWSFEVSEGTVVDLGVFKPVIGWQKGDKRQSLLEAVVTYALTPKYQTSPHSTPNSRPIHLEWHKRAEADMPYPPNVKDAKIVEASFTRSKFTNYLPRALGGVDKFKPVSGGSEMDHAEEAVSQLIIAGGDGTVDLEMAEHSLDAVALLVERSVILDLHAAV